ncbi:MAG TPA: 2-hydroxyacid dehydrogenase [Acidobacteriaceae bacterium]|jgi:phosphoglycerate dehydrogenase-like enzyme|nr:2-hydroxyacid dehydrogenase [Acidobacteriaceae bacterium]
MIRVGVEAALDPTLFEGFTPLAELVRLPEELDGDLDVEFWLSPVKLATLAQQLPHLRGLKVIQSIWAGVDAQRPLVPSGVMLCDARGVHDISTAEWTLAAILAMQKYLPFYFELQQQEDWSRRPEAQQLYLESHGLTKGFYPPAVVDELAGTTVLIVGYGSIGQAIEARLTPFGCKFLRVARHGREGVAPVERLDAVLGEADIVILIVPSTAETHHLMTAERLGKLRHGALLVNAARGPVVDTGALLDALMAKRIRAAVDVTDPEPLPPGHPLWRAPNLLITPHVAGSTAKFLGRAIKLASEQVERYARREPLLNVVSGSY